MGSNIRKGRGLSSQTKEVVFNVFKWIENRFGDTNGVSQLVELTSAATGVSTASIYRIRKDGKELAEENEKRFRSPSKKRPRKAPVTNIKDYEKAYIRNVIYNFHKTEETRMCIRSLNQKLKNDFGWRGERTSLRSILRDMGFRWRKAENNRKLLIEKSDIRLLRINYLEKIKLARTRNRHIVYLDETYINASHTVTKAWSDGSNEGLKCPISKGQRLIIAHAGGEMGFLPNCLLIFKSGAKTGDYHDDMNGSNYEKWVKQQLLPNLPKNSVVVIDNAPYHGVHKNKAPNSTAKKDDMIKWLTNHNINFSVNMYKPQLYCLIKENKKTFETYRVDELIKENHHTVLRLPPYHPDLNPIEMIWAQVKNAVASKNVTFKLDDVRRLAEEEFRNVTVDEWKKCCEKVIKQEDEYLNREIHLDVHVEPLVISVNGDSDSDSDDYESIDEDD